MSTLRCYQHSLVYPSSSEELQLEQVRALLPQYAYQPPEESTNTVVHYQKHKVYPDADHEFQPEQVRASLPQYDLSCDMEMTEVCAAPHWHQRNPPM